MSSTAGPRPRMVDGLQQGAADEVLAAEQVALVEIEAARPRRRG